MTRQTSTAVPRYAIVITDEDANPNDPPVREYTIDEDHPGQRDPLSSAHASIRSIFFGAGFANPETLPAKPGTVRARSTKDGESRTLCANVSNLYPEEADALQGIPAGLYPMQADEWTTPEDDSPQATSTPVSDLLLGLLRAMKNSETCAATAATTTATSTALDLAHDPKVHARRWEALTAKAEAREALQTLCTRLGLDYAAAWRRFDAEDLAATQEATTELRTILDTNP